MAKMRATVTDDVFELLASGERSATSNGSGIDLRSGSFAGLVFTLDVTAAASTVADKLDVYVQTRLDGTNWTDVARFGQCLGNGGAKRHIAKIVRITKESGFEVGTALSTNAVRNCFGDQYRVRWDITDDSSSAAFTFSVSAMPQ